MDALNERLRDIPPFTRYWLGGIVSTAVLSSLSIVSKNSFTYVPEKLWTQPWRIITSFCYFGDFLVGFFINLWFLVMKSQVLENHYTLNGTSLPYLLSRKLDAGRRTTLLLKMENNSTADYVYFIGQVSASILIASSLAEMYIFMRFSELGSFLQEIIGYIWSRVNSNAEANVFGLFTVPMPYIPFIFTAVNMVFTFLRLPTGARNLTHLSKFRAVFYEIIISYSISHFWWFTKFYLLDSVYRNGRKEKRREHLEKVYKKKQVNFLEEIILIFFLPPWYWVIAFLT